MIPLESCGVCHDDGSFASAPAYHALPPIEMFSDVGFAAVGDDLVVSFDLTVDGGTLLLLVKPQFEAGRQEAARGRGIITDPAIWRRVLVEVVDRAEEAGAGLAGLVPSPITGAAGNVEFVARLRRGGPSMPDRERAIDDAVTRAGATASKTDRSCRD